MKLIALLNFIFFAYSISFANILIQGPRVDHLEFNSYLKEKGAVSLKEWLFLSDQNKINLDLIVHSGQKLLLGESSIDEFFEFIKNQRKEGAPTTEWRQALIDILLKWSLANTHRRLEVLDDICFFYHLDHNIKEAHSELSSQCQISRRTELLEKPVSLKDDLIIIEGIAWNSTVSFFKRNKSKIENILIHVYSDRFSPVQLSQRSIDLTNLNRKELTTGSCHQIQKNFDSLEKYNIPLFQLQILSEGGCVDFAEVPQKDNKTHFWNENKTWLIVSGLVLGGLVLSLTKDKDISFEFSY